MAKWLIKKSTLTATADAIRAKLGTEEPIAVTDLASSILLIGEEEEEEEAES